MAALATENKQSIAPEAAPQQNLAELGVAEAIATVNELENQQETGGAFDDAFSEFSPEEAQEQELEQNQESDMRSPEQEREELKALITEQQAQLERQAKIAEGNRQGTTKNLAEVSKNINEAGTWSYLSGSTEALQQEKQATEKLLDAQLDKEISLKRAVGDVRVTMDEVQDLEREAKELEKAGRMDEAKERYAQIDNTLRETHEKLNNNSAIDKDAMKEYMMSLSASSELQRNAGDRLETTENVATTVRNVAVGTVAAGAAVVAAPVVLAAAGVAATTTTVLAAGTAVGTATGAALGAASSYIEAEGHIAYGNKTEEQAYNDAWNSTVDYTKSSFVSAVGGSVGGIVVKGLGKVVGNLADDAIAGVGRVLGDKAAKVAQVVKDVSAGAGEQSVESLAEGTIKTGIDVATGKVAFSAAVVTGLATNAVVDGAFGKIGKAVNVRMDEVAGAATNGISRGLAAVVREGGEVGVAVSKSAVNSVINDKEFEGESAAANKGASRLASIGKGLSKT